MLIFLFLYLLAFIPMRAIGKASSILSILFALMLSAAILVLVSILFYLAIAIGVFGRPELAIETGIFLGVICLVRVAWLLCNRTSVKPSKATLG